ncbi:MAG: hypothetical protein Aurels2KO_13410 [Aureliella sp.]
MHSRIAAIEQDFRSAWEGFAPADYEKFLTQVPTANRLELLTRLLSAELEFSFQPPSRLLTPQVVAAGTDIGSVDDDERVRPCVQLFTIRFPEIASNEKALIQLIVLEYALRLHHDAMPPNPESYVGLCDSQSHGRLIQLLELTEDRLPNSQTHEEPREVVHGDSTVKDKQLPSLVPIEPLPSHLGSYLLVRLIGRGGMGYVYSAIDLHSTARVAIKFMRRVDSWSVFRFFEEFRWLSQLEHPNLLKLYNAYTDGDSRYFSMELVEGHTILKWFKGLPQNSETRWTLLRKVLSQLASAIHYLHRNRILHCDIKCSNMMITARLRAVVLDLGLSVREGQSNPLVGTIQYMAPEVLNKEAPTKSSDWYSFGVMMYEVMAGKYPSIDVDVGPDGDAIYTADSTTLRAELSDCPQDLRSLCLSLISAKADERPSGAYVMAVLGGEAAEAVLSTPVHACPGRRRELTMLNKALEKSGENPRRCAVVHGESGIGKSVLLQHWLESIDTDQRLVASTRCYHQDQTPNRLLNALVQELMLVLGSTPDEIWRPGLKRRIDRIGQLFPQLYELFEDRPKKHLPRPAGMLPRKECEQDLLAWLVEVSHVKPIVIAVDNAHWADQAGIRALTQLQAMPAFNGLIVLANNSPDPLLNFLRFDEDTLTEAPAPPATISIPLGPLSKETCSLLLTAWTNDAGVKITDLAIDRLTRFSGGNPFLLRELSHAFVHNCKYSPDEDAVSKIGDADTHSVVRRRFASLPRNAELALEFMAVANHPLGFHQLQMLTRIIPQDLLRSLSLLRTQGWIRTRPGSADSDVEITHERFRRVIVQGILPDRLHRRHARIARILSNESPPPWARIANHYWLADRFPEAAACYVEAASGAYATGAVEEALFFLKRTTHETVVRSTAEQDVIDRLHADCLSSVGNTQGAAQLYEKVATHSTGQDRLLFRSLAGEQWIRAGQPEIGLALILDSLESIGISKRASTALSALKLLGSTLRKGSRQSARPVIGGEPFTEIEACLNRLASPLTFLENAIGQELIASLNKLAEKKGTLSDRSQAANRTAVILSFVGRRWRPAALRQLHYGRQLAHASGLDSSLAVWNFCMFVWHIQKGDVGKAIEHGNRSIQRFSMTRERYHWEQQFLRWGVLCCYYHSGQFHQLRRATTEQRESVKNRSDPMSLFWRHVAAAHWSDLVADQTENARKSVEIALNSVDKNTFQLRRFFLWLSHVQQYLYEGNSAEATRILKQSWTRFSWNLSLSTNHYRWFALHTRVCCHLLAAQEFPESAGKSISQARRYARKMLRLQEPAFTSYGRALLLAINAMDGKIATHAAWEGEIDRLELYRHGLMADALRWHYHLITNKDESSINALEEKLVDSGCVNPARLMNLVIPLPRRQ